MKPSTFDAGDFALGTWRILDEPNPLTTREIATLLHESLAQGIDTIDSAEIYGGYEVEAALCTVLAAAPELRGKFRIITKAGINVPSTEKAKARLPHYDATAGNLVACAEKSLRLLQTDHIDLFLVHRPDWLTHPEDTAAGLKHLLDSGKVANVGVSNYTPSQFQTLNHFLDGQLATNQIEFSPFHMNPIDDGVFDQCIESGIRPIAWSPLGGGRLFDQKDAAATRVRACLGELQQRYGEIDLASLIYAWILAHPARPSVILGTSKGERLAAAVRAPSLEIDRQEWFEIWQAAQGKPVP